ncbi:MAG: hypothetical protein ACTSXA_07420 [Candidatus Heimdallarchaeota archaeon]
MVIRLKTIKSKKAHIFLILLILVQIVLVLSSPQGLGKGNDENYYLNLNNPIPATEFDNIRVENDILFTYRAPFETNEINIYNVTDHLNFQYYSTYTLNNSIADNSSIVKHRIFDDKMFIVIQIENNSATEKYQTAIEIVDISDVQNPVYLSHMIFNVTGRAEHPYNPDYNYRMFYKDDLLYITVYVNSNLFYGDSIYVLNCTDIYHPEEIIRTDYKMDDERFLFDFYLIDDFLYTFVVENHTVKLCIYNYTDLTNITTISLMDELSLGPYEPIYPFIPCRFIGLYNNYFFINTNIGQCSLEIYDNYTLGFVNNWSFSDPLSTACIIGPRLFSMSHQNFYIYNITEIDSIQLIRNFTADPSADVYFQRLAIDKTRAYISSGVALGSTPILYLIDFSDEVNLVQLLPEDTAIAALPLLSVLFTLSLVAILKPYKKRKKY